MNEQQRRLHQPYEPKEFDRYAEIIWKGFSRFLGEGLNSAPTCDWLEPQALAEKMRVWLKSAESLSSHERHRELADLFFRHSRRLHSPNYLGHQVAPPVPIGALYDFLTAACNQGSLYEMSPFGTVVERLLVQRFLGFVGWDPVVSDGILTHGGSLANTTALLTARNVRYPDSWRKGVDGKRRLVFVSEDSHYSVSRAFGILGFGTDQIQKISVDFDRRMKMDELKKAFAEAKKRGDDVFCVVAAAGATPTGSFDPIDEMAEICRAHRVWLHVDAAHGGAALLSKRFRGLLNGIERSDSIVWDAHKMHYMPIISTFVLYREKAHSYQAFQQDAPYLWNTMDEDRYQFDSGLRTLECTKRAIGLPLFASLAILGESYFEGLVDNAFDRTRAFYELLEEQPDFEPLHRPQANILCFRYLPKGRGGEQSSEFHTRIRESVVEAGTFYLTGTRLNGEYVLRVTLMNPFVEDSHLRGLLDEIRRVAKSF